MRRRSSRISGFFLARSWWANVVLGVAFYLLFDTAFDLLIARPGRLGLVAIDIFGLIPGATLAFFLMLAVASVIERRRRPKQGAGSEEQGAESQRKEPPDIG